MRSRMLASGTISASDISLSFMIVRLVSCRCPLIPAECPEERSRLVFWRALSTIHMCHCHSVTHFEICSFLHGSAFRERLRYHRGLSGVDPKLGEKECDCKNQTYAHLVCACVRTSRHYFSTQCETVELSGVLTLTANIALGRCDRGGRSWSR